MQQTVNVHGLDLGSSGNVVQSPMLAVGGIAGALEAIGIKLSSNDAGLVEAKLSIRNSDSLFVFAGDPTHLG